MLYHQKYLQLKKFHIANYNLGAHYCRRRWRRWCCYFCPYSLRFTNIDITQRFKHQDIEICALKLSFGMQNICILTLYRALSGNFSTFLLQLDTVLQSLYTPRLHFIICGDININYITRVETKANWTTYYCPITWPASLISWREYLWYRNT